MKILVDVEPKVCNECIFNHLNEETDNWDDRKVLKYRCRLTGDELCHIYDHKSKSCPLVAFKL